MAAHSGESFRGTLKVRSPKTAQPSSTSYSEISGPLLLVSNRVFVILSAGNMLNKLGAGGSVSSAGRRSCAHYSGYRMREGSEMLSMTRTELHALVWSKPMTEIAKLYGVRDQHVAQACDAYQIARPRAGHWQRMEHGKAVETTVLDNRNYPSEEVVIIDAAGEKPGRLRQGAGQEAPRRQVA
jgi:hypothetical protein